MKNNSNRTPPLLRGLVIVAGFLLLIWGGFHLWQWHKLRPLRAAMDSFTTESAMEPISIYPVTIQPQQITPKARELMVQFVKSLGSPVIDDAIPAGGWSFTYTALKARSPSLPDGRFCSWKTAPDCKPTSTIPTRKSISSWMRKSAACLTKRQSAKDWTFPDFLQKCTVFPGEFLYSPGIFSAAAPFFHKLS